MVKICLNNEEIGQIKFAKYEEIVEFITAKTLLSPSEFYLEQNGKRLSHTATNVDYSESHNVHCQLRLCGGKGGFGSMLRAIGAQIEKTTNREACRDLSGRRLRDINEEKRLKAWLDKQGEREREAEERKKRKLEKLLAVPKHDFKDAEYEAARSKLTEKVSDAVEEGFKKAEEAKKSGATNAEGNALKRKATTASTEVKPKKKAALWIGDDISDGSDDDSSDSSEDEKEPETKKAVKA